MELRQLRYFVRVVELGSMGSAAHDLGLVQSALSQQISRLEGELSTRLLHRTSKGVTPTEAGLAFFREAQLSLRHAEQASRAAQHSRLAGHVRVGLSPAMASVLGLPFLLAMRDRYPDVTVRLQESFFNTNQLHLRQVDMTVLFQPQDGRGWTIQPLVRERLFLVRPRSQAGPRPAARVRLSQLKDVPLVVNIGPRGLRFVVDTAFARARIQPLIVAEVDSIPLTLDAVAAGMGAAIASWAGLGPARDADERFHLAEITDATARRSAWLCSLSDSELSPAALGARMVLLNVARDLVRSGRWKGVDLLPFDAAPPPLHES
ncbi:MAG: LysR family transcriptional regulator [Burkholderiales bacterium]|nr:LysR family transcriptional regulator [Burkholderiales bacterium]